MVLANADAKKRPIKITYYVSPHEFWFKYVDDDREAAIEDERMQEKIDRLADRSESHRNCHGLKIGDIVIVQCQFMDSKFIRARVDYELNYAQGYQIVLWAIDYGFPMRSNKKFVVTKVTSAELKTDNPRVFKATCAGVVPAQPDFDYFQSKTVMRNKPAWTEKAINEFEKIYSNGESLYFRCFCNVAEQHVYGCLEVLLSSGKTVNMDEALKKIDEAMDTRDFETEFQSLMHKDYWLQQENYKIMENAADSNAAAVKALKPTNKRDKNIVTKVNEWDGLNTRLTSHPTASLNTSSSTDSSSNMESSSNSSSPKLEKLPLNKRYEYYSRQDTTTATSGKSGVSTTKRDDSVPESTFSSGKNANAVLKTHFRKVLVEDTFSTCQPKRVLVHCRIGLHTSPVSLIRDVNFESVLHDNLRKMGITDVYRTQTVAWPHLLRGHSLIVINAAKSGKTWTYLPAVCSLAMEHESVVDGHGPVAVIICLDSGAVNAVRKQCEELVKGSGVSVKSFSLHDDENVQECHMLNGIDILVTSIPNLLQLINNPLGVFDAKRLKRVVFDEMDSMYQRFGEQTVHKVYSSLFNPAADKQFILTSKIWHKNLKKFCGKEDLMLCIGAYVEAAIYSNIQITVESTNEQNHFQRFFEHFKNGKYLHESTVIVCQKSEEVRRIEKCFRNNGYADVTYCEDDDVDTEKIDRINQDVSRNNATAIGVLVCTDGRLADLRFRNAQHIIHYSLPDSWTAFAQRFVVSFEYYENMVGDGLSSGRPTSHIFVDEHSSNTMPRLVEFMKTRCFAAVPEYVQTWANNKRMEQVAQNKRYIPFCNRMLLFGVCDTQDACSVTSRHFLTGLDRAPEHFPRSGKIKFEILTVHSPAHFTVRILEHRSLNQNEWKKPYLDDASFRLRLDKHFDNPANLIVHHSPKVGDLCVVEDDDEGEKFKRCQVIFVDEGKREKMIWLLDVNVIEKCHRSQPLYVLPDEFKCYPPQAVDIRIASVVPLDLSSTWDKCLTPRVRQWCEFRENCHFEATIKMTLMKCIWVKSVEVVEKLFAIDEELVRFDFRKEIINEKLGYPEDNAFPLLRDMALKSGLLEHDEPLDSPPKNAKSLASELVVRKPSVSEPIVQTPSADEPPVNDRDILRTPTQLMAINNQERGRGRGRVLTDGSVLQSPGSAMSRSPSNPQSPVSSCSEYGRSPVLSRHGPISNKLASRNIVSKPAKQWAELTPNEYIEVDIGEFYSPYRIYVLLASEFSRFKRLRKTIHNFVMKRSNLMPLIDVEVSALCFARKDNDYRRAQILRVNGPMVNVFLLDYGVEELNVPVDELFQMPEQFITRLPFQAILCNMVGIRQTNGMSLDDSYQNIYDTLDDSRELFVRCTGSPSVSNDPIGCNSYEVVFFDKSSEKNVNEFVVRNGFADHDPDTKHLADVDVDWNCLQLVDEDWDDGYDDDPYDDECNETPDDGKDGKGYAHGDEKLDWEDEDWDVYQLNEFLPPALRGLLKSDNDHPLPAILDSAAGNETNKMPEIEQPPMPDLIPATAAAANDDSATNHKPAKDVTYRLESTSKMPYIVWRQTETMIHLSLSAPDVKDYSLKVGSRYVQFCFVVNDQRYENILNLFGCVDAKYTSHEVQGLKIVIRLMKTLAAEHWPRLEKWPGRNQFIKCVAECDDSDSDENDPDERKFLPLADGTDSSFSDDDEYDEDNEDILNSMEI